MNIHIDTNELLSYIEGCFNAENSPEGMSNSQEPIPSTFSPPLPDETFLVQVLVTHINKSVENFSLGLRESIANIKDNFISHVISRPFSDWDYKYVTDSFKNYFDIDDYQSPEEKRDLFKIEVVLKSTIILYLSMDIGISFEIYESVEALQAVYSEFIRLDLEELEYLLKFGNFMRIALRVIEPRFNKRLLLYICALLEGADREYITGGGETVLTKRRVLIYEIESGVQPIPRKRRNSKKQRKNALKEISSDRSIELVEKDSKISDHKVDNEVNRTTKQYITCDCGIQLQKKNLNGHLKTKRHISIVEEMKYNNSNSDKDLFDERVTKRMKLFDPFERIDLQNSNQELFPSLL